MYTVARFTTTRGDLEALHEVGNRVRQRRPTSTSTRRAGDGFTSEICSDDAWNVHVSAIERFIEELADEVRDATAVGATVTIDVAVEPEDCLTTVTVLRLDERLLRMLAECSASLELSVYGGQSPPGA